MELAVLVVYYTRLDHDGVVPVPMRIASKSISNAHGVTHEVVLTVDPLRSAPNQSLVGDLIQKASMLTQLLLLLLLAMGWKTSREQLTARQTRLVLLCFGVYVLVCASQSVCQAGVASGDPFGMSRLCETYNLGEYILQSIILLGACLSL